MSKPLFQIVELEHAGQRIDRYLADQLDMSRTKIAQLIKEEKVLVNQQPVKSSYLIEVDDEITIDKVLETSETLEPVEMELDIVYEDDDFLVVNKPKGLVVHPGAGTTEPTLVQGLLAYTSKLSKIDDPIRPGLVHRLDKDTSGLLVVAKNEISHLSLAQQLADHSMGRTYLAIVYGDVEFNKAQVDAPIGRDPKFRQKMAVTDKNSKSAITHIQVLKRSTKYSLLQCSLETGRTHQIRVHCAYINHPIVGDTLYGPKKGIQLDGQLLHSYRLELIHPTTLERMVFTVEPPLSFNEFLEEVHHGT